LKFAGKTNEKQAAHRKNICKKSILIQKRLIIYAFVLIKPYGEGLETIDLFSVFLIT